MTASEALPAVLDRIDSDLDASLDRLFALLRIQSISTDPAYAPQCRPAPSTLPPICAASASKRGCGRPRDIRSSSARANGQGNGHGAARPFLRPLRRAAGRSARPVEDAAVRAAHRNARWRPQDHRRARRLRRQRPGDDLRRSLPRLQGGDRQAAARHYDDDRGRGGVRLETACSASCATTRPSSSAIWRSSATPACGTRRRRRSPPRCAALCTRRCG